ncbi:tRNA dihydrouridine(20/20a) synthase DusA [Methylocapsa sp. D3K7]|uniref:tRNA dihydrouridine(20/20a) synthase DusA n=1 Tax=Methylocapsa sp. D3K7 TaxID=3041435 RepID=UPI00244E9991|nr:tRNA dihydrouridine(20/20a) synthase DusA [Methylocapsa sp. D3K7]WGJ16645.1 tRNA dihydrouridine(20/20a) synthase DusA [Methylocapsa sp. D3K7]
MEGKSCNFSRFRFSVAPMMDWTDRHCRSFHRILSRRARLYTEMLAVGAVLHGDRGRLLRFEPAEHPLALQIGGSDPAQLAAASAIGEDWGYDEINLNIGCPSERVKSGAFGACLMREPELVGDCVAAIKARVKIPVTVKCRTGVDEQDPEAALGDLAARVVAAGCDALIVHARKAWLSGLSPKENRNVPPLDYALVHVLKRRYPAVPVVLNGGLATLGQARAELEYVDGVMVGRAAYQDPALLLDVDPLLFGETAPVGTMATAIEAFIPYVEARLAEGVPLHALTRHLLGFFNGLPGARAWRRHLATEAVKPGAGVHTLHTAMAHLELASMRGASAAA